MIKAHGGDMAISSLPGQGTTVRIRLPRVPGPARTETAGIPAPPAAPRRVLLVDDDEDVRVLMERMLRKAGVGQVETVSGGEEALESLRFRDLPDLVILDQNMPGMDGIQALSRIRALHPDMPILISSGQPGIQEWACFQQSDVAVISKPFDMEEIQAVLAQFK